MSIRKSMAAVGAVGLMVLTVGMGLGTAAHASTTLFGDPCPGLLNKISNVGSKIDFLTQEQKDDEQILIGYTDEGKGGFFYATELLGEIKLDQELLAAWQIVKNKLVSEYYHDGCNMLLLSGSGSGGGGGAPGSELKQ